MFKYSQRFQHSVATSNFANFAKFALLSSTFASACSPLARASEQTFPLEKLEVQTITSSEEGFLVNSHLVLGKKNAILIDAQFTESDSQKVIDAIKKSGKKLQSVFITHGHPDHYFGLTKIAAAFPSAKLVTTPSVLEDMKETAQAKHDYWKPIYKDNLAKKITFPKAISASVLELDGQTLNLESVQNAEAHEQVVVKIPGANAVVMGDLLYNNVHLWLAEGRAENWKEVLLKLQKSLPKNSKLIPGHGAPGEMQLLSDNVNYIDAFQAAVKQGSATQAKELMKKQYPKYALPVILDIAVDSAFAAKK